MSIQYTNQHGITYYLCRGTTKTGKPRYCFAREPKGEPVAQIPPGYRITESVNGVVSLSMGGWRYLFPDDRIEELAEKIISPLGTDAFFESF
jgi:hypothetical protein